MRSFRWKLGISVCLLAVIVVAVGLVGLTDEERDDTRGVMIDFGYWDVVWTELTFPEGADGYDALEMACDLNGFVLAYSDPEKTQVSSVNGQINLVGMEWGMYVLEDGEWVSAEDPSAVDMHEAGLVSWARAAGPETVTPGADDTGFTYYGYADRGMSVKTGEKLKVVSLAPSITEILCSVGGMEYIVGTDVFSNYPQGIVDMKEAGEITDVGGYTDPNYEWILRLAPDVVFCDGGTGEHLAMANKLRKSGLDCVVMYDAVDIGRLYDNQWIAASAIGFSGNAGAAIEAERVTMDTVTGIIGTQPMKRVFVSLSVAPSPWTSGSDTFMSDLVSKAGGGNVFDTQASSWFMVSKEQIYSKQPNVMIVIYDSKEISSQEEYEAILDGMDPLWKQTPAFRNGNVFLFSGDSADILSRPGPRLAEADELLAKVMFPDCFTDRDPLDRVPKWFGDDYATYLTYQRAVA